MSNTVESPPTRPKSGLVSPPDQALFCSIATPGIPADLWRAPPLSSSTDARPKAIPGERPNRVVASQSCLPISGLTVGRPHISIIPVSIAYRISPAMFFTSHLR
jgi:hypothetical protein